MIYLYDNHISRIENINFAENLTHLYLQNNRLQKLENLDACPRLQKLYLGGNQIQVLEGLDRCPQLSEVYIENQRLPDGEKLVFEPRTLQALSRILGQSGQRLRIVDQQGSLFSSEVLNVSGNNLDSLVELSSLEKLQELTASNNNLENLRELVQLISVWPWMKRLDTSRNPMCSKARYRERLIVVSTTLGRHLSVLDCTNLSDDWFVEILDGKPITDNSRKFLMSWKASREAQQTREKSRPDFNDLSKDHGGKLTIDRSKRVIRDRTSLLLGSSWFFLYVSLISFCLSSEYSFQCCANAINDNTANVRSVHWLPSSVTKSVVSLLLMSLRWSDPF